MDLRVGNGARVVALAIGTNDITLPSGLILSLENCYYVPTMSTNIIYVSCLDKIGFELLLGIISAPFIMMMFSIDMLHELMVFMF